MIERPPSSGLCYGCRHDDHCHGTGDLEPTEGMWPGFVCTCDCRPESGHTVPDCIYTILLILLIIVALPYLGVRL